MKHRKGFSLVELMVVISIIVILVSFLLPALSGPCGYADEVKCLVNLRTLSEAHIIYAFDHAHKFPTDWEYLHDEPIPGGWPRNLPDLPKKSAFIKQGYIDHTRVFLCPCDDGRREDHPELANGYQYLRPAKFSYSRNAHESYGVPYARIAQISKTALLIEEWEFSPMNDGIFWANAFDFLTQRHKGFANMSFYDGHAEPVDAVLYNSQSAQWRKNNYLLPQ